jgi:hypothetical protein
MQDPELRGWLERETIAEMVPVARMVHPSYARNLIGSRIKKLVADWDYDACDVLVLSLREDGSYAIIDGCHRHRSAELLHITDLPARVFIDLTVDREAQLFVKLNRDRSAPTPMDVFRARLVALEDIALDLRAVVQVTGFDIATEHRGPRYIEAVSALESVYDMVGPRGVDAVLTILRDAWGMERQRTTHGHILRGLGAFWLRYSETAKRQRLIERLALLSPEMVLAGALTYMTIKTGVAPHSAVGRFVVDKYNVGLQANLRLNDWQDHTPPAPRKAPLRKHPHKDQRPRG